MPIQTPPAPQPPASRPAASSETDIHSMVVAVYETHAQAETAVRTLEKSGIDMKKLSIVGKDFQTAENVTGYYNTGDRMMAWGKTGATWGGIWGLLFGSAYFLVPGVGPILAAGPVVGWMVAALQSAVVAGGAGVLAGALFSVGIPEDSTLAYETELLAGKFVVIAHGDAGETAKSKAALAGSEHVTIEELRCIQ